MLPIDLNIHPAESEIETPVDGSMLEIPIQNGLYQLIPELEESRVRPEILIVEDDDELRDYLLAELQREFTVLEARDGEEGLSVATHRVPI